MVDIEKLQKLNEEGKLSDAAVKLEQKRLAFRVLRKEGHASSVNGIVYVVLAFCLGCIGAHNFYARYWKRGLTQLVLTLLAPYALFLPLIFASLWAMLELLFINKGPDGVLFSGNRKVIWGMRIIVVLVLGWFFSSPDLMVHDMDWVLNEEM